VSFLSAPTQAFRPSDQPRWVAQRRRLRFKVARFGAADGDGRPSQTGSPCGSLRSGSRRGYLACPQTWRSEAQPHWLSRHQELVDVDSAVSADRKRWSSHCRFSDPLRCLAIQRVQPALYLRRFVSEPCLAVRGAASLGGYWRNRARRVSTSSSLSSMPARIGSSVGLPAAMSCLRAVVASKTASNSRVR
jgi:hypothetical protein